MIKTACYTSALLFLAVLAVLVLVGCSASTPNGPTPVAGGNQASGPNTVVGGLPTVPTPAVPSPVVPPTPVPTALQLTIVVREGSSPDRLFLSVETLPSGSFRWIRWDYGDGQTDLTFGSLTWHSYTTAIRPLTVTAVVTLADGGTQTVTLTLPI